MHVEWNLGVLSPRHKKQDPMAGANYRDLLSIACKIQVSVLCEILKPTVNRLITHFECFFKPKGNHL